MIPGPDTTEKNLYDTDFQLWIDRTVEQLKTQDFANLDLVNLIDEVGGIGREQKRELRTYLRTICENLITHQYSRPSHDRFYPELEANILNFRFEAESILDDSPSLLEYLQENFDQTYREARELVIIQFDLAADTVPETPWFTLSQGLDEDWYPPQPNHDSERLS